MFGFIKRIFLTGLTVLSSLTSATPLSCISMNNQEFKVRPEIINANSDEPVFYPFSIKINKCKINVVVVVILMIHKQKRVFLL